MWTGYRRRSNPLNLQYPLFVFIEHDKDTDANEIFKMYFNHYPHEYGKPDWDFMSNDNLLVLIGFITHCSHEWCDCEDSFELSYTYFIKKEKGYRGDMDKLNAFLKRDDVLFLSEREIGV